MNDEQAFLRAIIEQPDDALPKLIFADWLEENGQEERGGRVRLCASNGWPIEAADEGHPWTSAGPLIKPGYDAKDYQWHVKEKELLARWGWGR